MTFSEHLGDRTYFSRYSQETVGFVVHVNGVPSDADEGVIVEMETLDSATTIFQRDANHPAIGVYEVQLSSIETQTPGIYRLVWTYRVNGIDQKFTNLIEVGESSAAYDALTDELKMVIESVWLRFADLFDSPNGGPHLQVYYQTTFGRTKMVGLLKIAVGKLNTLAQPRTTYSIDGTKKFPVAEWGALLEQAAYVEAIKHLVRSYVEQPNAVSVNVARLDRRDYMDRWERVLRMEQEDLDSQLEIFKMAHMGLGRAHVMVSGGVYGQFGPTRLAHSAAARPRYYMAFHV